MWVRYLETNDPDYSIREEVSSGKISVVPTPRYDVTYEELNMVDMEKAWKVARRFRKSRIHTINTDGQYTVWETNNATK